MKKNLLLILGLLILLIGAGYFVRGTGNLLPGTGGKMPVSASFYPLYFFASEVGGEKAAVTNLTPAGVEPHDYDPTPQDIVQLQKSRLLIINGAGFEPWIENLRRDLTGVTIVDASQGISLQAGEVIHEEEGEEAHAEEEAAPRDPHVWLSPVLAREQVRNILAGFEQVDSTNSQAYRTNAAALEARLTDLDTAFREGLRTCRTRTFITSHAAFGYLAREYQLTQIPITGLSPDQEPSTAEMAEIVELVRKNGITHIFFETLVSPRLAETIAKETGAQTLVLDPLEGLSDDAIREGTDYFTVMEQNLENLKTALECTK